MASIAQTVCRVQPQGIIARERERERELGKGGGQVTA